MSWRFSSRYGILAVENTLMEMAGLAAERPAGRADPERGDGTTVGHGLRGEDMMTKRESVLSLLAEGLGIGTAFYLALGVFEVTKVVNGPPDYDLWQLTYWWPNLALEAGIALALLLAIMVAAWLVLRRGFLPALRRMAGAFGVGAAKGLALTAVLGILMPL